MNIKALRLTAKTHCQMLQSIREATEFGRDAARLC